MAPSLATIPDHWLWLGLGVFTFIAIKQVSHSLHNIRSITEVRHPSTSQNHPTRLPPNPTHQEDAIKTSSLLTLATSPNIDIRTSATKILCHRFYASSSAKKLLVRDLSSKNDEVKHRAQLAYNLLYDNNVLHGSSLNPRLAREGWRLYEPGRGVDEMDLRRRRREAVVIHDGDVDRPIGAGDVYMRDEEGGLQARGEMVEGINGLVLRGAGSAGGERWPADGYPADMEELMASLREAGEIEMVGASILVAEESDEEEFQVTPA